MRTFEKFIVEAEGFQGKMTPDHNAKKGAIAVKNLLSKPKPKFSPAVARAKSDPLKRAYEAGKQKSLPAAADKGSAIVRQKQGGTGKEAIGGNKMKSGPGVRQPDKGPGSKTYDRTTKDGSALAKNKPEVTAQQGPEKDPNPKARAAMERRKKEAAATATKEKQDHDSKAGDRLNKRRGGIGGGIKKALGGDVIGVRAKSGETEADKEVRKDANSKARADFAQKKVGQAGNAVKGAGNSAKNFVKNALKNPSKDVGSVEGKEGSSAGRMQKQY
jgi:hypothetical protein